MDFEETVMSSFKSGILGSLNTEISAKQSTSQ